MRVCSFLKGSLLSLLMQVFSLNLEIISSSILSICMLELQAYYMTTEHLCGHWDLNFGG